MGSRQRGVWLLLVVGVFSLAAGLLTAYARDLVVDSDELADKAAVAFANPRVRDEMTGQIFGQLTAAEPELLAVQPLLESVVDGVLGSDPAVNVVRAAVADLHRTVFAAGSDTLTLQLTDLVLVAKTQLTVLDPEIGALIPDELTDAIVSVDANALLVDGAQLAENLQVLAFVLPALSLAAFLAVLWLGADPNRMLARIGIAGIAAAGLALIAMAIVNSLVTSSADTDVEAELAGIVLDAFAADFDTWALVLAGVGAVIAAVGWFAIGDIGLETLIERLRRLTRRRSSTLGRLGWGAAVAAVGLVLVAESQLAVRFIVTIVGVVGITLGFQEVLLTLVPKLGAAAEVGAPGEGRGGRRQLARWVATAVLVGLGLGGLFAMQRSGGDERAGLDRGCNGDVALCSRSLDEIVLAATHNSHAAANDEFAFGYQTIGVTPQLEQGIRGLLVDVYFGLDAGPDLVVTDRSPVTPEERELLVAEMGESAVQSAEALVIDNEQSGGERALYLCHAFCEIGAAPFIDELDKMKEFLDEHPREVIVVIIQDEGPRPDDIVAALEERGLDQLVYTHDPEAGWPTLEQMIERDERVFVSAENISGGVAWYHDAFALVQDTPFKYESVEDFDCAPDRGDDDNPLLLVNHWLSPVSSRAAEMANEAVVLRDRYEQCRVERDRLPNLIAVDFHDRGDLIAVVEDLNGL